MRRGSYSAKDVFLPSTKHLLSAFYNNPPLRTLLRTSVCIETLTRRLLRTLLRNVRLHDPLGVRPEASSPQIRACNSQAELPFVPKLGRKIAEP